MKYLKDGRILKGSLQERRLRCGNPGCRCHKRGGVGHGPYVYLAAIWEGKTHPLLLKKEDIPLVRRSLSRYEALWKVIEEAVKKNAERLRKGGGRS